ncbi:MAG TPA: hypothetical protein VHQ47_17355 [Phycisphaerae bacterium]|nr:hypothetical protein [Phycisphaerae bacterium]
MSFEFSNNPFRTLGLSAAASQAAIDAAARRLRIYPDPASIPPTPFDLPTLGPLPRTPTDIEQALAALYDPLTRIDARLFWFTADHPPALADLPSSDSPDSRHNALIRTLCFQNPPPPDLVPQFESHALAPDTLPWLLDLEHAGDFEKPATPDEIAAALEAFPANCAAAYLPRARAAIERADLATLLPIAALLHAARCPQVRALHPQLLDILEDNLVKRCDMFDAQLRDTLRTNEQLPHNFYAKNLAVTQDVSAAIDSTLSPFLRHLPEIAPDDPDRVARIRHQVGLLLALLALGWDWSGRFIDAEETYEKSLAMVAGSPAEARIRDDLERLRPKAHEQREAVERARLQYLAAQRTIQRESTFTTDWVGLNTGKPLTQSTTQRTVAFTPPIVKRRRSVLRSMLGLALLLVTFSFILGVLIYFLTPNPAPQDLLPTAPPAAALPPAPRPAALPPPAPDPYAPLLEHTPRLTPDSPFADTNHEP